MAGTKPAPPGLLQGLIEALPPASQDLPATFLFSFPKAGSTMLNKAFEVLCAGAGIPHTNIPGHFFRLGTGGKWQHYDLGAAYTDGYCHRGYRYLPTCLVDHPLLKTRRSILLVRDVRDCATSHYYSMINEHPLPGGGAGAAADRFRAKRARQASITVDENAIQYAADFNKNWANYRDNLPIATGLAKVYRYEDIVFSKREFLADAAAHLNLPFSEDLIADAARRVDVFPEEENQQRRIRVVRPGNHREKLQPKTIERINDDCRDYLSHFGYLP